METRGRRAETEYTDTIDIGCFRALTLSSLALTRDTRAGNDRGQGPVTTVIRDSRSAAKRVEKRIRKQRLIVKSRHLGQPQMSRSVATGQLQH